MTIRFLEELCDGIDPEGGTLTWPGHSMPVPAHTVDCSPVTRDTPTETLPAPQQLQMTIQYRDDVREICIVIPLDDETPVISMCETHVGLVRTMRMNLTAHTADDALWFLTDIRDRLREAGARVADTPAPEHP